MAALPAYKPTGRSFKPATYAVRKKRTVSGRTVRVISGLYPSNGSMTLIYGGDAGLLDDEANEFVTAWKENSSVVGTLTMPAEAFAGMSAKLKGAFQDVPRWAFSVEPPKIEPTIPGRSRVTITLEHRLSTGRL